MLGTRWYNLALYTDPECFSATVYTAALQTDGQTDIMMMPIADHTVQKHDRLKTDRKIFRTDSTAPMSSPRES